MKVQAAVHLGTRTDLVIREIDLEEPRPDEVPPVFIPRLLEYHRAGSFPFEKMLHFYRFDEIEKAFEASRSCSVVKPVVLLEE